MLAALKIAIKSTCDLLLHDLLKVQSSNFKEESSEPLTKTFTSTSEDQRNHLQALGN